MTQETERDRELQLLSESDEGKRLGGRGGAKFHLSEKVTIFQVPAYSSFR